MSSTKRKAKGDLWNFGDLAAGKKNNEDKDILGVLAYSVYDDEHINRN